MEQDNKKLMEIKYTDIPMTNNYKKRFFYVRDCYDTYYKYVDDFLKGKDRPEEGTQMKKKKGQTILK